MADIGSRLSAAIQRTNRVLGALAEAERRKAEGEKRLEEIQEALSATVEAHELVKAAVETAQSAFIKQLESHANLTIQSVLERPMSVVIDTTPKGGRAAAKILIQEGNNLFEPSSQEGGGLMDMVSIGLMVAFWKPRRKTIRAFMALDEATKFVGSGEPATRAIQVLKVLSKVNNLQILFPTHYREEAARAADVAYEMIHDGLITTAVKLKGEPAPNIAIPRIRL